MNNQIIWGWTNKPATREAVLNHVGKGWHPIVNSLIDDLFTLGWNGVLIQIKEKFGGLRFYVGAGNEAIWNRIQQAENKSFKICEECGKPGELRYGGWMRTLCDKHAEEFGYEKE